MGEQVDLSSALKHKVTEIFTRVYSEPRSLLLTGLPR